MTIPLPPVACIVVNYRAAHLVARNLPATLAALRDIPGSRLFVVDNASPGDDARTLRAAAANETDVEVIAHERNDGFAAGNNVGFAALRRAEAERGAPFGYVFLLNPDAWPEPGSLKTLVSFAQDCPEGGIFGPAITESDGRVHWSAFRFPSVAGEIEGRAGTGPITRLLGKARVSPPPRSEAHRTDWVSGAALLLRREVLDRLGDMDEAYFLYFEEADYQLQAQRAGFQTWYVPQARMTHLQGASTGMAVANRSEAGLPDYWFRSRRRFFEKNFGSRYADRADRAWLWASRFFVLRQKVLRRPDGGRADAIGRFLANRGKTGQGRPGEAG
ncbi:glycosyltransferase family 2 protein [Parvularcula oceani]|uniref:glycosyltransferase family 2 protein n=1 Tax=Parvularcula oceani TaxID=1247963 RepID=UPI000690244B|nr:glycosyltransferase family 2 protein [Parvularcula oceani]